MNYIGSKYSLLNFIQETITDVANDVPVNGVFADLFAGTGVVGSAYRKNGYSVIANDIQYYSYVLNRHFIENTDDIDLSLLDYLNSLPGKEGFVYENFCAGSGCGRNYFSDENGLKCDAARSELQRLLIKGEISNNTYYFGLASLIESIDRCANTASVYGAFLKHIKKSAQKEMVIKPSPVVTGTIGRAYCEDANLLISRIEGDILYLDPPYNARQYCANYHVLETIARYDYPELHGKTGLRDYSQQKSSFCSRKDVLSVFEDLISKAKFRYIFLSYNNEGLMALDSIEPVMRKYGRYSCRTMAYRRFKADQDNNRRIAATSTIEYLHCLEKDI